MGFQKKYSFWFIFLQFFLWNHAHKFIKNEFIMVQTSCAHTEGSFAHEDGKTLPCNTGKSFGLRDYREVVFPQTC